MKESYVKGLVSVIIPTFNRAHYLGDALHSLERQSYRPIQVIVVDDGSTDETPELLSHWEERLAGADGIKVDYIRQENQGACVARNVGIVQADGEFVQFVDSDDILFPYALEWAVGRLADPQLDYVYFKVHRSDENLIPLPGAYIGEPLTGTSADVCAYFWHTMGAIYRRETVRMTGFWNEDLAGSQDWEYAARVKLMDLRALHDPRVVGLFRNHSRERIGVKLFSHPYVASVEKACDSIRAHAERAGRLDTTIRRALARRLFIHAVEFGANGYEEDKQRLLQKSLDLQNEGGVLPALIKGFRLVRSRHVASGCLRLNAAKGRLATMRHPDRGEFTATINALSHTPYSSSESYYRYRLGDTH